MAVDTGPGSRQPGNVMIRPSLSFGRSSASVIKSGERRLPLISASLTQLANYLVDLLFSYRSTPLVAKPFPEIFLSIDFRIGCRSPFLRLLLMLFILFFEGCIWHFFEHLNRFLGSSELAWIPPIPASNLTNVW